MKKTLLTLLSIFAINYGLNASATATADLDADTGYHAAFGRAAVNQNVTLHFPLPAADNHDLPQFGAGMPCPGAPRKGHTQGYNFDKGLWDFEPAV